MHAAVIAVQNGEMGYLKASKQFGVPKSTLIRHVKRQTVSAEAEPVPVRLGRYRPVFTDEQEQVLKAHILAMEQRFFGMTTTDVRYLAYHMAERNNIDHNFNKETELAGKDWLVGFQQRHPDLTLRVPEATSAARARAFNRANVSRFFDLLEEVLDSGRFPPHRIFNCDETGLTTVQAKSSKVFAEKGRRQVGSLTSAERGVLSTAVICMSAGGQFIPPYLIFPRARMNPELMTGTPPGSDYTCHPSGWMQLDIFTEWFRHFLRHAKPTEDDPALLVLDGHLTHTKNMEVIDLARANHVTLLVLPPHSTHRLQPLDVGFMFPLSKFYGQAIQKWLRNNPSRVVTVHQVGQLFGEAYLRAAAPSTAINAFRRTGICPCDRDVFGDADFAPAEATDQPEARSASAQVPDQLEPRSASARASDQLEPCSSRDGASDPLESRTASTETSEPPEPRSARTGASDRSEPRSVSTGASDLPEPRSPSARASDRLPPRLASARASDHPQLSSTSAGASDQPQPRSASTETPEPPEARIARAGASAQFTPRSNSPLAVPGPSGLQVSPDQIIPIPKRSINAPRRSRRGARTGKCVVLTSSPYKRELQIEEMKKRREAKRKLQTDEEGKTKKAKKQTKAPAKKKGQRSERSKDSSEESAEEASKDPKCLYCTESFTRSAEGEGWARCCKCKLWAHDLCAGLDEDDDEFTCDLCLK